MTGTPQRRKWTNGDVGDVVDAITLVTSRQELEQLVCDVMNDLHEAGAEWSENAQLAYEYEVGMGDDL